MKANEKKNFKYFLKNYCNFIADYVIRCFSFIGVMFLIICGNLIWDGQESLARLFILLGGIFYVVIPFILTKLNEKISG